MKTVFLYIYIDSGPWDLKAPSMAPIFYLSDTTVPLIIVRLLLHFPFKIHPRHLY